MGSVGLVKQALMQGVRRLLVVSLEVVEKVVDGKAILCLLSVSGEDSARRTQ